MNTFLIILLIILLIFTFFKIKKYILHYFGMYLESGIPDKFGDFKDNNEPKINKFVYIKKGIYSGKIGIIKDVYSLY